MVHKRRHDADLEDLQAVFERPLTPTELEDFIKLFNETFEITKPVESGAASTGSALPGKSGYRDRLIMAAVNMERSIKVLGPALAEVETPVSPQLVRSLQATENVWREMSAEFGLLSSMEVSELVGSKSPNRSYASEQQNKGRLIAIKRPGGLRYPGFQFDRSEHAIRPVMADLIRTAAEAGRSRASLALWMMSPSGYLDGARPVDQLSYPEKVVEAARQSFNVQW